MRRRGENPGTWGLELLRYLAEGRVPEAFSGQGSRRWKALVALALLRFRLDGMNRCGRGFSRRVWEAARELFGPGSRLVWILEKRLESLGAGSNRGRSPFENEEASGTHWIIRSEADHRARRRTPGRFFHIPRRDRGYPVRRMG